MMQLSFVFSFKNEEENIPELVLRVSKVCKKIKIKHFELIFVNDRSTDRSEAVLKELQKQYPIRILNMTRTFGTAPCVLAGLRHSNGEAIVYMDSDLQDPPELVEKMFECYLQGAEVVHTQRQRRLGESKFKLTLTSLAYKMINWFSDIVVPHNVGDFKLVSAAAAKDILKLNEDDPFMRGLSLWVGRRQQTISYDREPRHRGVTKFPVLSKNPIREFVRGFTSFSAAPLYFSLTLGVFTLFVALLFIIYAILTKLLGAAVPGASGVIIVVALLNGVLLVSNGILGIYIAKIFFQVKQRPQYLIESIIEKQQNNDQL